MIDAHTFCLDGKKYLFDYRNLIILDINNDIYKKINANVDDRVLYCSELKEYIQCGLFCDNQKNKFIELDSDVAYLSIPTVHSCNMKCRYCFADAGMTYKGKEKVMTPEKLDEILIFFFSTFMDHSKYRIDFVSGGEPLLNLEVIKQTNDKVKEMSNKETLIWMATNGLLLNGENVDYLNNNNIQFGVSIDGTKEFHDANRIDVNGNGTFDRIMENIQMIKDNKTYNRNTKDIWVLTTITAETNSLVDILKEYRKRGIRRVQMKIVRAGKENISGLNEQTVNHFIQLYRELITFLKNEIFLNKLDSIEMIMNRNDMFGKVLITLLLREPCITRCLAGRDKISISADGSIYPCEEFIGVETFCIGDIYKGLRNDNPFEKLNVYSQENCERCWAKYVCGGGCYYRNFVESGNIGTGSTAYCQFYKKLVEMTIDLLSFIQENDETFKKIEKIATGKRSMEW